MRKLSLNMMHRGCNRDRETFEKEFGDEVEITAEICQTMATKFDWVRGASLFLTPAQHRYFKTLVISAFRGVKRQPDPTKIRRMKALANCFYLAYNSREE